MNVNTVGIALVTLTSSFGVLSSCGSPKPRDSTPPVGARTAPAPVPDWVAILNETNRTHTKGPSIEIREATTPALTPRASPPKAETLDATATASILKRLPPMPVASSTPISPVSTVGSERPPTPGTVITPFPTSTNTAPPLTSTLPPDRTPTLPLEVIRYGPRGEVTASAAISMTFSQPMVSLASLAQVARTVPATLKPMIPGKWRWVGTDTLVFEPHERLPDATTFRVQVDADAHSVTGTRLAAAPTYEFATRVPALAKDQYYPDTNDETGLEPPIVLVFDQPVDANSVLDSTQITVNDRPVAHRFITENELRTILAQHRAADASDLDHLYENALYLAREAVYHGHGDRLVLLRAIEPLPADAHVVVTIGPAPLSPDGPRASPRTSIEFRTYDPLTVDEVYCDDTCPHGSPWRFSLSNWVTDVAGGAVTVEPNIQPYVSARYGDILIDGAIQPDTTYRVTFAGSIVDRHGQKLVQPRTFTITTGPETPSPSSLHVDAQMYVIDPHAPTPTLSFNVEHVARVQVELRRVRPLDWLQFAAYHRWTDDADTPRPTLPGAVTDTRVYQPDDTGEVTVDLSPALRRDLGHAVVVIRPLDWTPNNNEPAPIEVVWAQRTQLAVDAFLDPTEVLARVTRLADGTPAPGASVELRPRLVRGRTDGQGLTTLSLPTVPDNDGPTLLIARRGADSVFINSEDSWSGNWVRGDTGVERLWYVFDDRSLYLPGDTVHLKGWLRDLPGHKHRNQLRIPRVRMLTYEIVDRRGHTLANGNARLSPAGGFDLSFQLSHTAALGDARVNLSADGDNHAHRFRIARFRRPTFEVSVTRTHPIATLDQRVRLTTEARYYTGGGVSRARTSWTLRAKASSYRPPGHDRFAFGISTDGARSHAHAEGTTDAAGNHAVDIRLQHAQPVPIALTASVSVQDIDRRHVTSERTVLVHPSRVYLGLDTEYLFIDEGLPLEIHTLPVELDGTPAAGRPVTVSAVRTDTVWRDGGWKEIVSPPRICHLKSNGHVQTCRFDALGSGRWTITGEVTDIVGRINRTQITRWVSGIERHQSTSITLEDIEIITDRNSYTPGDRASLLVQAPFAPAYGILTLQREGVIETRPLSLSSTRERIVIDIDDRYTPNVHVGIELSGATVRENADAKLDASIPRRPAFASGTATLDVPPVHRRLQLSVAPSTPMVAPGADTAVEIRITQSDGQPVAGAEVSVAVVDEALLALTDRQPLDPLPEFYPQRDPNVEAIRTREWVTLVAPTVFKGATITDALYVKGRTAQVPKVRIGNALAVGGAPIVTRSRFDSLALFVPAIVTDRDGRISVPVTLPDSVTRYRIMVAAVAGHAQFGAAESSVTAALPLIARPSPPRFLHVGDRFELPVIVSNRTDERQTVDVVVRTRGLDITGSPGRRVVVLPDDRAEVRFPAHAVRAGLAVVQTGTTTKHLFDGQVQSIPVSVPGAIESMATYGAIDAGTAIQVVTRPAGAMMDIGGLDISLSSTQLHSLTDALVYFQEYPYRCSEQLASRILALATMRDALGSLTTAGVPTPTEMTSAIQRDLDELATRQRDDGGFGLWTRRGYEAPVFSIHVAHALARSRAHGMSVDPVVYDRAREYLRGIRSLFISESDNTATEIWLRAYALYVLRFMGDDVSTAADAVITDAGGADRLPIDVAALLTTALANDADANRTRADLVRVIENSVHVTTAGATFATSDTRIDANAILHSSRRTDGIALEALISASPNSNLIPKLVHGLLVNRQRGVWIGTQENAFILLALERYVRTYERAIPDFIGEAWLGTQLAGQRRFRGRSAERHTIAIPMARLSDQATDVILNKRGSGRLYYRLGMRYVADGRTIPATSRGMSLVRRYEGLDDTTDVTDVDGGVRIRAGARVRVSVTLMVPTGRHHVALVDRLPAGLEPVSIEFPASNRGQVTLMGDFRARRQWYQHAERHDDRVQAFTAYLPEGVWELSYIAVATTPGAFVAAPAKAEEMYSPETFGRTASTQVYVTTTHTQSLSR